MTQILNIDYTIFLILSSLLISILLGWASIKLAPGINLMDIPGSAIHKTHSKPIPLTGGVVLIDTIFLLTVFTGLWKESEVFAILVSGLIIAGFGLLDDFINLAPIQKLVGQFLGASLLIYLGVQIQFFDSPEFFYRTNSSLDLWLNILFTVLWIVTITNAFNFIDSIDGLAIGLSSVSIAFFLFISILSGQLPIIYFCSILLGIFIGIYFFNAHPAKLFLGDSGAQTIGFLLASIAIVFDPNTGNQSSTWFVPILFFAVPIFDLMLVVISRIRRKKNIYTASRDHTFHRLEQRGLLIQHAVLIMHGVSLIMSMVGYLCLNLPLLYANIILLLTVALGIVIIIKLDYHYS